MVRLPWLGRNENTTAQTPTGEDRRVASSDSAGLGHKLAVALGIGALAYLLVRRRNREDSGLGQQLPDPFGSDESEGDGLEGAQKITIDDPSSESDRDDADGDGSIESASTTDRSAAEIDERAETDVQEEPAEPGKMTIDEEVAEEVVDDETDEADEREGDDEPHVEDDDTTGTDDTDAEDA